MPVTLDDDLDHPWPEPAPRRSRLMPDPDDPRNRTLSEFRTPRSRVSGDAQSAAFDVVGPQPPRRSCWIHSDCDAADPGERHVPVGAIKDPEVPKGLAYLIDQGAMVFEPVEENWAAEPVHDSPDDVRRHATNNGWGEGMLNGVSVLVPPGYKDPSQRSGNPKDAIGDTKPPLHLVPAALGIYASQAMANGAAKYGPFNWRKNPVRAEVYVSAALRHLAAWFDGEDHAEDSGVHHLAHAAAGLAILLDAMATGNLIDNRPVSGPAARLIAEFTRAQ